MFLTFVLDGKTAAPEPVFLEPAVSAAGTLIRPDLHTDWTAAEIANAAIVADHDGARAY